MFFSRTSLPGVLKSPALHEVMKPLRHLQAIAADAHADEKGEFGATRLVHEESEKIAKVMKEFKDGTLKSSSGEKVTDRSQAIAIALSEAGLSKKEEKKVEKSIEENLSPEMVDRVLDMFNMAKNENGQLLRSVLSCLIF